MSLTKSEQLASLLYQSVLVPIAEEKRHDAEGFISLLPDVECDTYYSEPMQSGLSMEDCRLDCGNAESLLTSLEKYWAEVSPELVPLIPKMRDIANALANENISNDGDVDVLCYTLF